MKIVINKKNNIKIISLFNWFNRFNKSNLLIKSINNTYIDNIFILFVKWQFQYKKLNSSFNIGVYWEQIYKYLLKHKLLGLKLKLIIRSNYVQFINLFISKFIKIVQSAHFSRPGYTLILLALIS